MRKRSTVTGSTININLKSGSGNGHPSWGIITALRGVDAVVRSQASASCDRVDQSKFPAVSGKTGDFLLLSMCFDDTSRPEKFTKPPGTAQLEFVYGNDEAGGVWGYTFSSDKSSGVLTTGGVGGSACKDALISLVLKGSGSTTVDTPTTNSGGTGTLVSSDAGTCDAFCKTQGTGITCEGAWEDNANQCATFLARETCAINIKDKYSTSDMCCKCSKATSSDRCDGKVLTSTVAVHKTCNNYCKSVGKQCAGAWEDDQNDCNSIKAKETCSTDFFVKYAATSDMICKCVAPGTQAAVVCVDDGTFKNTQGETCADFAKIDCASSALTEDERVDLAKNCPYSCGFCAQSTTPKAVIDPDCNPTSWPDRVSTNVSCGHCTAALTETSITKYQGLCSVYCKTVAQMACLSAWAFDEDTCSNATQLSCDRKPPYPTDTRCECGKPVDPTKFESADAPTSSAPPAHGGAYALCLAAAALLFLW